MADLKIAKVLTLPQEQEPHTLYLLPDTEYPSELKIVCTDGQGVASCAVIDRHLVQNLLDAAVMKAPQTVADATMTNPVGIGEDGKLWTTKSPVTTTIHTAYMPNVGDSTSMRLGEQIVLSLRKTSNSGNEVYRSEITAFSQDRYICYRRDSMYDSSSAEGSNENDFLLKFGVVTVVDSTVYGSMRDFARVVFVDLVTLESWIVRKFHFSKGYFRAIIEHHVDPTVPSASVPLPAIAQP